MGYADIPGKTYGAHDGEMARLFKTAGWENIDAVHYGKDDDGLDCVWYGATASTYVWWDESADTWYFGQSDYGPDVYMYGATANNYLLWDASDDALELVNTTKKVFDITSTLTGAAAVDTAKITITDSTTVASGSVIGLYIAHTSSGAKTGSGTACAVNVDLLITQSIAGYAYAQALYIGPTSGKNINHMAGLSMYLGNCGSGTVSRYYGLDIGKESTNTAADSDAFIRMYTAAGTTGALFRVESTTTYVFDFQGNVAPVEDASVTGHGGTVYKVKSKIGATTVYFLASSAPS